MKKDFRLALQKTNPASLLHVAKISFVLICKRPSLRAISLQSTNMHANATDLPERGTLVVLHASHDFIQYQKYDQAPKGKGVS